MPDTPVLTASGLTFRYHNRASEIITNFSISLQRSETVALTGPSGRGKSTLLYLLGLMLRPTSGDLTVLGRALAGATDFERSRERAQRFGFVFQDAALDATRTVLDNVTEPVLYKRTGRKQAEHRARQLLEEYGVGLRTTARPTQVSGGQAQRVALCRALIHEPDVILADEPTGNLDINTRDIVIDGLRSYAAAGRTVVIVTHDRDVAAVADRIIEV